MTAPEDTKASRSKLFRVLGDENRLRILECLFDTALNVGDISTKLQIEQSLLSHHLSSLRKSNLLVSFRKGKEIFYQISESVKIEGCERGIDLQCCSIIFPDKIAEVSIP